MAVLSNKNFEISLDDKEVVLSRRVNRLVCVVWTLQSLVANYGKQAVRVCWVHFKAWAFNVEGIYTKTLWRNNRKYVEQKYYYD